MEQRHIEVLAIKKIQELGQYRMSRRQSDMWKRRYRKGVVIGRQR